MYENITYEDIMARMLARVPSTTMDKREGSIIYDALAACAFEMKLMYVEMDTVLKQAFADTSDREYLVRTCLEVGITPTPATYAVVKGVFSPSNIAIAIGSRFSLGKINYTVISKLSDGMYELKCDTVGEVGNAALGQMIPIDYIDGLQTSTLTDILIPGEDEEDVESLRKRYFEHFKSQSFGGNVADYLEKTNGIAGVGSTKVTPVWNGGGTVLLTILNSEFDVASETLVNLVQTTIDPDENASGLGLAPIGHSVTVHSAESVTVNVTCHLVIAASYTFTSLKPTIEAAVKAYFLKLRQDWDKEKNTVVRISQIETKILQVEGVLDVESTKLNGTAANIELTAYQVPVLGGVVNE